VTGAIAIPLSGRKGERGNAKAARPGGADISALALACELHRRGRRIKILVHREGPTVDYVEELGLEAIPLDVPFLKKREPITDELLGRLARRRKAIAKTVQAHDIGIVHTNDANMHRTWGFLCEWLTLRHVWHERGLFWHPPVSQSHLRRAAAVLAISNFVRDLAPGDVRPRVQVIDNPIVLPDVPPKHDNRLWLRRELGIDPACKVVAMVANANKRKRWDVFFEAAAKAARQRSDLNFCVIGVEDSAFLDEMRSTFWSAEIAGRLHLLGYRYDVPRIMSGADAVVATAEQEPLGRTIVESVLAETPILAARSGAHVELLAPRAPFCLVRLNPADFAKRLISIEALELQYAPVAEALRSDFRRRFDPERHRETVEAVYAAVLAGPAAELDQAAPPRPTSAAWLARGLQLLRGQSAP
jgi:glycosyltransferase involved in cell wall biosynthesis